jgi:hypothetical protein
MELMKVTVRLKKVEVKKRGERVEIDMHLMLKACFSSFRHEVNMWTTCVPVGSNIDLTL